MERPLAPVRTPFCHFIVDSDVLTKSEIAECKSKRSHSISCHQNRCNDPETVDTMKLAEEGPCGSSNAKDDNLSCSSSFDEALILWSSAQTKPEAEDTETEQAFETKYDCSHAGSCIESTEMPEDKNCIAESADTEDAIEGVTLMIRNLPPLLKQAQLIEAIDKLGLQEHISLLYLPVNFKNSNKVLNKGFAFIHMSSKSAAETLISEWHHTFAFGRVRGRRALNIGRAHTQGHQATLSQWLGSTTGRIRNRRFAPIANSTDETAGLPANFV